MPPEEREPDVNEHEEEDEHEEEESSPELDEELANAVEELANLIDSELEFFRQRLEALERTANERSGDGAAEALSARVGAVEDLVGNFQSDLNGLRDQLGRPDGIPRPVHIWFRKPGDH